MDRSIVHVKSQGQRGAMHICSLKTHIGSSVHGQTNAVAVLKEGHCSFASPAPSSLQKGEE